MLTMRVICLSFNFMTLTKRAGEPNVKHMRRLSFVKILILTVVTLFIISCVFVLNLRAQIQDRLRQGWFSPPIEFYSGPETFHMDEKLTPKDFAERLKSRGYRLRTGEQRLNPGDYAVWTKAECQSNLSEPLPEESAQCLVFFRPKGVDWEEALNGFAVSDLGRIVALYRGQPLARADEVFFEPRLFAQFYGDRPILRKVVPLGEVPLACLQAVTAIEDSDFLEHSGVSFKGTARAAMRNISHGRWAEGGSTITQQLVKNYFLSSEKTLFRKITEQFMAILLEAQVDKDVILQAYLNEIYMGQSGAFEIRGFAAASEHYFAKSISDLDVAECALLAAMINSPGRFSPFASPKRASERRELVLERMEKLSNINKNERIAESAKPLPTRLARALDEPAPYVIRQTRKELEANHISTQSGLRIFTSIWPQSQDAAQKAVALGVENLEASPRFKHPKGRLQSALISVDLKTGHVLSLVGGREYKQTQFNRVTESLRQVGSIMKPIVYLTALESLNEKGERYTPLTVLEDAPFTYKYHGKTWTPRNYEGKFLGRVPMYFALKNSMNVPTAKLAIAVGLDNIVDVARRLGVKSRLEAVPSLSLGAFELSPWEVAETYLTLGRLGDKIPLRVLLKVTDLEGRVIYQPAVSAPEQAVAPETVAVLLGMLKQTLLSGTAKAAKAMGYAKVAAGKTGTTSDTKDAWFVGMTPRILTVNWVGFDDNTPHGLTGASGALPIWVAYMKDATDRFPDQDFSWPPSVRHKILTAQDFPEFMDHPEAESASEIDLIVR